MSSLRYSEKEIEGTYSLVSELGHDSLECSLVLFEQAIKLLVLMLQRLVLNNNRGIHSLQLGFKNLCASPVRRVNILLQCIRQGKLTLAQVRIKPPQRKPSTIMYSLTL